MTVMDQFNNVIGTAVLAAGTYNAQASPRYPVVGCIFPFEIAGVPEVALYWIGYGSPSRWIIDFTLDEMMASGWTVFLTVG